MNVPPDPVAPVPEMRKQRLAVLESSGRAARDMVVTATVTGVPEPDGVNALKFVYVEKEAVGPSVLYATLPHLGPVADAVFWKVIVESWNH